MISIYDHPCQRGPQPAPAQALAHAGAVLTGGLRPVYTRPTMAVRHAFILAGSLWETARFFIVISLLAQLFHAAGNGGPGIIPWLLLGGSGNLLVAVGGFMLSLFPERYGEMIGFLRLGKVLSLFCFLLLMVSGAILISARTKVLQIGPVVLNQGAVLFAVFLLDLLFLAALIGWRPEKNSSFPAVP